MGSFANQLFSWLMGWLQSAVSMVWSAFTAPGGNSLLTWIGDHWVTLAVVLCLVGVVADLAVYLFRWRPARVWASFFRRLRRRRSDREAPEMAALAETDSGESWDEAGDAAEAQARRMEEIYEEERQALARRENAEAALRRRRRRRFVTEEGERVSMASAPPQMLFDSRESYRNPVYPRKWKDQHESDNPDADE